MDEPYLIIHGYYPSCYQCMVLERDPVIFFGWAVYGPDAWWRARSGVCHGIYLDVCYADDVVECQVGLESWHEVSHDMCHLVLMIFVLFVAFVLLLTFVLLMTVILQMTLDLLMTVGLANDFFLTDDI